MAVHKNKKTGGFEVFVYQARIYSTREVEIRADEIECGDYLLGLGRVQSYTEGGTGRARRVTLQGDDWKVSVHPQHRVVVIRRV